MNLSQYQPGQPVELQAMKDARLNGQRGFLVNPEPDEYGLHAVRFELKPATRMRDATTKDLRVSASKINVLADQKPPKDFIWHFHAKNYRYAVLPSGEQPQQLPE